MRGWIDDIDVLLEKFDNFFSIKIIENGEGIFYYELCGKEVKNIIVKV